MRNWGIVVTAFYVVVVILLFSVGVLALAEGWRPTLDSWNLSDAEELVSMALIPTVILFCGQVLLLFLSVDSSWRRLKPQRHAKLTAGLVGMLVALLFISGFFALGMAYAGDDFMASAFPEISDGQALSASLISVVSIWAIWAVVFYVFSKRASKVVDTAVSWLIKGSVLELLVAVPCHIIVRQREWCCAQYVSAYGIAAGIAIMLLAFGPSCLLLYKRKLDEYKDRSPA